MIIIKILAAIGGLICAVLVIAAFTKKQYTLQRSILINKPVEAVFDFIRYNRNQHLYSVWLSFDPKTKIELQGAADGTAGAVLAFESKNKKTGTGEWEIRKILPAERLDFQLRFKAPFAFIADGYFLTERTDAATTRLSWVYNSGMEWPMNIMLVFMDMDKIVGGDLEKSLNNIKRILEK